VLVYKWCVYSYYERRIWRSGIGEIDCVRTSRSVGSQLGQARGSIPERRGVRSEELRGEKENEMLIILEIDNGRGEHNRAEQRRGAGCYLEGLHKGHFPLLVAEQLLVVTHTHAHEPLS
jgi:hypothetical protein